jgi:hypothetical protein
VVAAAVALATAAVVVVAAAVAAVTNQPLNYKRNKKGSEVFKDLGTFLFCYYLIKTEPLVPL